MNLIRGLSLVLLALKRLLIYIYYWWMMSSILCFYSPLWIPFLLLFPSATLFVHLVSSCKMAANRGMDSKAWNQWSSARPSRVKFSFYIHSRRKLCPRANTRRMFSSTIMQLCGVRGGRTINGGTSVANNLPGIVIAQVKLELRLLKLLLSWCEPILNARKLSKRNPLKRWRGILPVGVRRCLKTWCLIKRSWRKLWRR